MKLEVNHLDSAGKTNNASFSFRLPALIKHLGFAGMGFNPSINNYAKGIGAILLFHDHISLKNRNLIGFKEPTLDIYDPTTKGQFSNLLGKAIADFLSKKIYQAHCTFNYESIMSKQGLVILGSRPDLYCVNYTKSKQFAVEAKGLSRASVSNPYMKKVKKQSKTGPLSVHFSVASVAYNIYKDLHINFHDPVNPEILFNTEQNLQLIKEYYAGILEIINIINPRERTNHFGEEFYVIPILNNELRLWEGVMPKLLVTTKINQILESGRIPDSFGNIESSDQVYIDRDGIGIAI